MPTSKDPIEVGGPYVENEDHVPNPADMVNWYNTSGTGASERIEEVSHVFEADKVNVAKEIKAALDPKDTSVPSNRVLLPDDHVDNETAKKELKEAAEARLKEGVVIGGPTPAAREAAEEDNRGDVQEEARKSYSGRTTTPVEKTGTGSKSSSSGSDSKSSSSSSSSSTSKSGDKS